MSYPAALNVVARPSVEPGAATVIFVHGSLDRGDSFRRVMRRLPDLCTVAYDRRGYQGSRDGGVTDLRGHVVDLLAIAGAARRESDGPVVALGHSLGGDVVVGAALDESRRLRVDRRLRTAHAMARVPAGPAAPGTGGTGGTGRTGRPGVRRGGPPWPTTRRRRRSASSRAW